MEKPKIYVILNVDKFNHFCEEKLGSEITADDFIAMETFRNEKVHLVPKYGTITTNYYHSATKSKFNILVNVHDDWEEKSIVPITDKDIENLLSDGIIQDEKEFKQWENTFSYEVSDLVKFFKYVDGKFSDIEMISLLSANTLNKYDIFVVNIKNEYIIMYRDSKINCLKCLPNARLYKKDILDLINNDILISDKCKVNYECDAIKIDDKPYLMLLSTKSSPNIYMRIRPDRRYEVRIRTRNIDSHQISMARAFGKTEQDAIHSLKQRLLNRINAPNVTMRAYKHLIESKELELN